jgi:hypothetical protein
MNDKKSDLRDQARKNRPHLTPDTNDVKFAGDENRKVMPSSGKITSPDPGNVVEGQATKSN